MKVVKSSREMKLAAVFAVFAVAVLLSANISSRLNFNSFGMGVSLANAADETTETPTVNNAIVNEAPVSGDMAQ